MLDSLSPLKSSKRRLGTISNSEDKHSVDRSRRRIPHLRSQDPRHLKLASERSESGSECDLTDISAIDEDNADTLSVVEEDTRITSPAKINASSLTTRVLSGRVSKERSSDIPLGELDLSTKAINWRV